ncbi:MAG: calcium-binding protein, partial [Alphaproteobacteria bacterium]
GGAGNDTINGGEGNDWLSFSDLFAASQGVTVNLLLGTSSGAAGEDSLISIENLIGGSGNDVLIGSTGANTLYGDAGDDTINGGGGADRAEGGAGNDYIYAVIGVDVGIGGGGNDTLDTSLFSGNYLVNLQTGATNFPGESFTEFEAVIAGDGSDTLIGTDGANFMHGGAGNDSIMGGNGDDTINGGGGADTALGGAGNDYIYAVLGTDIAVGGSGNDTLDTSLFSGNYLVNLQTGATNFLGESFTEFEAVIAGTGSDTLIGTDGANFMHGGAGDDSILGGAGNDTLMGGSGMDFLSGGTGDDVILVGGTDLASILALFNTS